MYGLILKVMKCSLKLYIYYTLWFMDVVYGCSFIVLQVKVSKFTENGAFKRTESQEEIQAT